MEIYKRKFIPFTTVTLLYLTSGLLGIGIISIMYLDYVTVYQDYFVSGSIWLQPSFHRDLVGSSFVSCLLGLKVFVTTVWHLSLLFVLDTFSLLLIFLI